MHKQQFINYIKSPEKLDKESFHQLKAIINEYPYCQTANILYTLNLYNENHIKFNNHLKIATAYAADRKILKKLLHTVKENKRPDTAINYETHSGRKKVAEKQIIIKKNPEISESKPNIHNLINHLKKEINHILVKSNIDQDVSLMYNLTEKLEELNIRFESRNLSVQHKEKSIPSRIEYNFDHLDELAPEESKSNSNLELIEKFIEDEPKISPISKPHFFNPVDFAKQSLIDNESIVSETLATIYYQQGNPVKAIKIYKKLSLLYPEKSTYFAAQIKKIQKEIK